MNISKHALTRLQQRGIPKNYIDLIIQFGKPQYKPGGAVEYYIKKKDRTILKMHLKNLSNNIDRLADKAVLVIDDRIITVYHKK